MQLKVVVGIPSGEYWKSDFGMCMLNLMMDFSMQRIEGYEQQRVTVVKSEGSILPQLRGNIVKNSLKKGATHVLFIDTDQTFPADTLRRLLYWQKPVVACNVATKKFPSSPTARLKSVHDDKGEILYTTPESHGLEEVWRIGCGVMLLDLEKLRHIPLPWFGITWRPNVEDYQGEDWFFCEVLEKNKIPIYIDHDLSWQIGHVGKMEYKHDLVPVPEQLVKVPDNGMFIIGNNPPANKELERWDLKVR